MTALLRWLRGRFSPVPRPRAEARAELVLLRLDDISQDLRTAKKRLQALVDEPEGTDGV